MLQSSSDSLLLQALVDSGANTNLMDVQAAKSQLSLVKLSQPLSTSALDGRLTCKVTHQMSPVTLMFDYGHQEKLNFLLFESVNHPLVSGLPRLL